MNFLYNPDQDLFNSKGSDERQLTLTFVKLDPFYLKNLASVILYSTYLLSANSFGRREIFVSVTTWHIKEKALTWILKYLNKIEYQNLMEGIGRTSNWIKRLSISYLCLQISMMSPIKS
ncbi:hypothetical protein BpHYR1_025250 [Brachionus plicatilis]|uniref:Uncharacterized protein n=1 Tax=Brachionus plicatilis TaxID=10195 RepID=A0A3M7RS84_BRAPC|nr:hypothetical protein BpHYR1_025250 [Brachionus plicatilis]